MTWLKRVSSIDLRALALFRIGLAISLLVDLTNRASDLRAHYSDFGVLTRLDLSVLSHTPTSLHMISGASWFQALLFVSAALAGAALLVGWWTRLATFVSWGLLASLIARNPLLVQGGDNLLLLLLFWGLFLPLGARYSIDAAVDQAHTLRSLYWSMGTTALIVQVMALFFFSALLKSGSEWIPDGTAIAYVLNLDYFVRPIGIWLREYPWFTKALTFAVWYIELLSPLLIFFFWFQPLRLAAFVMLVSLQLGIAMTLNVGLFPLINISALLVLLPSDIWDSLARSFDSRRGAGLTIYYDDKCESCRKICLILRTFLLLKRTQLIPAQSANDLNRILEEQVTWVVEDEGGRRYLKWDAMALLFQRSCFSWIGHLLNTFPLRQLGNLFYRWFAGSRTRFGRLMKILCPYHTSLARPGMATNTLVGLLMIHILFINIQGLPSVGPGWAERLGNIRNLLHLNQRWDMFTPSPPKINIWYFVRGQLLDGTIVDVLNDTEGEPDRNQPIDLSRQYPRFRWEKYLSRLALPKFQSYRPAYARYLCQTWNESHAESSPLSRLWLFVSTATIELDGQPSHQESLLLLDYTCPFGKSP